MSQVEEWTPEIFSMGSGFKARVLYAQRKALAPVHLCLLCCPLTQPRLKLHSLLSVLWTLLLFPVLFIVLFSLLTISFCTPRVAKSYLPLGKPNSNTILHKVSLISSSNPITVPATNDYPPLWILKILYLYITYDNISYFVLRLFFTTCIRI